MKNNGARPLMRFMIIDRWKIAFFLPPYSPDRNPDELVWKHLKADTVGRMAVISREDFTKKVRRSMRNLQNDARNYLILSKNTPPKYEYTYGRINS